MRLLNSTDLERIKNLAATEPWAANVVASLVHEAEDWPARHVREYGLTTTPTSSIPKPAPKFSFVRIGAKQ